MDFFFHFLKKKICIKIRCGIAHSWKRLFAASTTLKKYQSNGYGMHRISVDFNQDTVCQEKRIFKKLEVYSDKTVFNTNITQNNIY